MTNTSAFSVRRSSAAFQEGHVMMPSLLVACPSITAMEKAHYLALSVFANNSTLYCFPSQTKLADMLGISQGTVSNTLASLAEKGVIFKRTLITASGPHCEYVLNDEWTPDDVPPAMRKAPNPSKPVIVRDGSDWPEQVESRWESSEPYQPTNSGYQPANEHYQPTNSGYQPANDGHQPANSNYANRTTLTELRSSAAAARAREIGEQKEQNKPEPSPGAVETARHLGYASPGPTVLRDIQSCIDQFAATTVDPVRVAQDDYRHWVEKTGKPPPVKLTTWRASMKRKSDATEWPDYQRGYQPPAAQHPARSNGVRPPAPPPEEAPRYRVPYHLAYPAPKPAEEVTPEPPPGYVRADSPHAQKTFAPPLPPSWRTEKESKP